MNPTTDPPAPPPPQPHRSSFTCDRHPDEQFTGFCPSCLCERLTTLDQSSSCSTSTTTRKPPSATTTTTTTAASALKAIFRVPTENSNRNKNKPSSSSTTSFFPELRRTKSFSAAKNEGFSGVFEPQRKSCDVRGRNTLWSLFNIDDERKSTKTDHPVEVETRNLGGSVLESKEEDEHEEPEEDEDEDDDDDDEIRACEEPNVVEETVEEIVEEDQEEVKKMKDHIDLDSQAKKPSGMDLKEIAGSFWSAASVFSKKWQNWRQKQKLKKRTTGGESAALPVEKPISRQYRETQSEIADYGFGRRSCDTDPRFSLDAGRMSFDDPRYSFDEPRASWDGHLIGRTFPRLPPMVSVVEDAPVVHVSRSDAQIPVEEPVNCINHEETIPGGSAQTRDYYLDSSSRRRKSLDRSSSIRSTAEAVVAEVDEMKAAAAASNSKVSPATLDYFNGSKFLVGDRDLRDLKSNSLRDDCSETFELGFRDNASVIGNEERKGVKKSRRWSKPWNIWGFIYNRRNGGNKDGDEERYSNRGNGVQRSFSESWQDLRREGNGDGEAKNRKVFRSNSSVSWRNSSYTNGNGGGSFGSVRKSSVDTNGNGIKKRDEFVLERNRSARYSPNNIDNGLLRFYLTPMRGSRRGGSGKNRPNNNSHSIARSVLRLY